MSRGGKSYTRQFKEQAMDLVRVQGLNPTHAARELAIPIQTLNVWLRKAGWVKPTEREVPLPEDPAALKVRVAELEQQVKRLQTPRALAENGSAKDVMKSDTLRLMARELAEMVRKMPKLDWTQRESVRADLRRNVRRLLAKFGYPPDLSDDATQLVLKQAELSTENGEE